MYTRTNHKPYEHDHRVKLESPLWECCSFRLGVSGLPYFCTPPVCVSDVIGVLPAWWYNKNKNTTIRVSQTMGIYVLLLHVSLHQLE